MLITACLVLIYNSDMHLSSAQMFFFFSFFQASDKSEHDIYIVTELMASDLHAIIRSQMLSNEHVKFFTYQILRALVVCVMIIVAWLKLP